jgi:hypothetical protein
MPDKAWILEKAAEGLGQEYDPATAAAGRLKASVISVKGRHQEKWLREQCDL